MIYNNTNDINAAVLMLPSCLEQICTLRGASNPASLKFHVLYYILTSLSSKYLSRRFFTIWDCINAVGYNCDLGS